MNYTNLQNAEKPLKITTLLTLMVAGQYLAILCELIEIRNQEKEPIDIAIELCMYCMKTQVFKDGNKRASVIFANHYLIAKGNGFLVIPEKEVPEFKELLIEYYEGAPLEVIGTFLRNKCWKNF